LGHNLNADIQINNPSLSNDVLLLESALEKIQKNKGLGTTIDIEDAGTPARFVLPVLCSTPGSWILTGTKRMQKRPMSDLVNALKQIGMNIRFLNEDGYLPLEIEGRTIEVQKKIELEIDTSISSQFASSLALSSSCFAEEFILRFKGEINSTSYLEMTLDLLQSWGRKHEWINDSTLLLSGDLKAKKIVDIEADWSSAAFWYCLLLFHSEGSIHLKNIDYPSLQADSFIHKFMLDQGLIESTKTAEGLLILGTSIQAKKIHINFNDCPDLAPVLIVALSLMDCDFSFDGVNRLQYKESNRLRVVFELLEVYSIRFSNLDGKWHKQGQYIPTKSVQRVNTHQDHRIAMAASLLALKNELIVEDIEVVKKSYPEFWDDLLKFKFVLHAVD
jgi:3-phosphoshikimate 1-carboxyvinyltransferase